MKDKLEPTPAERILIESVTRGGIANFQSGNAKLDDPAVGNQWGENRTLRAEFVRELCLGSDADLPVHPKGVVIVGARIVGGLGLQSAELAVPFCLWHCHLEEDIILREATTRTIILDGCHTKGIQAAGLTTRGNLFLRSGFTASGEVRLLGADIVGNLDCQSATIRCPGGIALSADSLTTKGRVALSDGFNAQGEVRFVGANIGGEFLCDRGTFDNPNGIAFYAERLTTKGNMSFGDARANGQVNLYGARVGPVLNCSGEVPGT